MYFISSTFLTVQAINVSCAGHALTTICLSGIVDWRILFHDPLNNEIFLFAIILVRDQGNTSKLHRWAGPWPPLFRLGTIHIVLIF